MEAHAHDTVKSLAEVRALVPIVPRAWNRMGPEKPTKTRHIPGTLPLQRGSRRQEWGHHLLTAQKYDIPRLHSSSEEMVKGKQCWLLPAHSNLKETGNLAFLETQGIPATNLLSSDSLYCPVPRPSVLREPASTVLTISLCLHLMSALPKLRVGRQAGRQVPGA